MSQSPIRVGIIGLGRSGWSIHAQAIQGMQDQFRVVAVTDAIPERLAQSAQELGCRAHGSIPALLADRDVELVIVSTFNYLHAKHAVQALRAGKHVLCEKPFGLTVAQVDAMLAAARDAGRILAPFQQRRYEPDFQKVKEVIDSGILGEIVHIRTAWHGFGRRWDWQTARVTGGGNLNNNGPHPLDHAMILFGEGEPQVWAQAGCYLCSGDAEDHLKVILYGPGHPTVEVELTSIWAYPQERWAVAGTRGGLHGNERKLEWKWVDFSTMPERPLDLRPMPDRSYNSENIEWQTATWEPGAQAQAGGAGAPPPVNSVNAFYADFYRALREGAPLVITPEEVRRRVAVMEKIRRSAGFVAVSKRPRQ
jgi:scyllo-inositol 2-dehydrogenase (NADP+)